MKAEINLVSRFSVAKQNVSVHGFLLINAKCSPIVTLIVHVTNFA